MTKSSECLPSLPTGRLIPADRALPRAAWVVHFEITGPRLLQTYYGELFGW